jgi:hypothetical protein
MTLLAAVQKQDLSTNITLFFYGNKKYSKEGGVGRGWIVDHTSVLNSCTHLFITRMYSDFFEYMSDEQMNT